MGADALSAPAFAWALERGCALRLSPAQRLVLIYLADKANGARVCWPGQETIVRFTGLALRTVRSVIHELSKLQLIRVEATAGYVTKYHIIRADTPADGNGVDHNHPGKSSQGTQANGNRAPRQNVSAHPGKRRPEPRDITTGTPAKCPPEPSINQEENLKTRTHVREGEVQDLNPGKQASEEAPPKAPTIGTTEDCSQSYIPAGTRTEPEDFQAFLATRRQQRDATDPEPAADTTAVKRAVAATIYSLKKYAQAEGVAPVRSRDEQIDQVLHGEILPPIRRGPVDPIRTPEQQYAELLGVSLAEATTALGRTIEATA